MEMTQRPTLLLNCVRMCDWRAGKLATADDRESADHDRDRIPFRDGLLWSGRVAASILCFLCVPLSPVQLLCMHVLTALSVPMLFVTYFMEIVIMVPLVTIFGYYQFNGLTSFGISYISAFIGSDPEPSLSLLI